MGHFTPWCPSCHFDYFESVSVIEMMSRNKISRRRQRYPLILLLDTVIQCYIISRRSSPQDRNSRVTSMNRRRRLSEDQVDVRQIQGHRIAEPAIGGPFPHTK